MTTNGLTAQNPATNVRARVGFCQPGSTAPRRWVRALLAVSALYATAAQAADSLCATVKIEIVQELTLERQAFDARMRISNGLDTLALQNVSVDVRFADDDDNPVLATSDPNDTNALFFIRIDSLDGISDVAGTGTRCASGRSRGDRRTGRFRGARDGPSAPLRRAPAHR
jgi:hypothetical protein